MEKTRPLTPAWADSTDANGKIYRSRFRCRTCHLVAGFHPNDPKDRRRAEYAIIAHATACREAAR